MKNVKNKKMMAVVLPEGCFYGNCSDCVYADRSLEEKKAVARNRCRRIRKRCGQQMKSMS